MTFARTAKALAMKTSLSGLSFDFCSLIDHTHSDLDEIESLSSFNLHGPGWLRMLNIKMLFA